MGYILTDTSPAYELVGDITVSSATTSVSFTGLNFTSADDLLLVSDATGLAGSVYMYANGNTTNTNYYTQSIRGDTSSVSSGRYNVPQHIYIYTNSSKTFSIAKVKLTNSGYFIYQSNTNMTYADPANYNLFNYYGTSTFTASSITSLTLTHQTASGIGIGSRFRLYKLVAEKVADITVSTATTSVDITGLSIDKGSEYMLVSDVMNATASNVGVAIYVNGNSTSTNYYTQYIVANGSSITSGRLNGSEIYSVEGNQKTFSIANIKLTNNGYFVWQSNYLYTYGSTNVKSVSEFGTSIFTSTSISSLTVSCGAYAISAGSRFQLYKLR